MIKLLAIIFVAFFLVALGGVILIQEAIDLATEEGSSTKGISK